MFKSNDIRCRVKVISYDRFNYNITNFRFLCLRTSSFASWIQSILGAQIPSGSLFALLQSIGMAGFSFNTGLYVTGVSAALPYAICKALGYDNDNNC